MADYSTDGKQYHIDVGEGDVGRYVILPGDPKRVKKIAKYLDNARPVADNREYVTWTGELDGEKVSVTSTGIGGPSAAIAVEELIKAGADTFIRVGTSGGINMNVKSGDLVIAQGAIRAEGTTKEYAPIEFPALADIDVIMALKEAADKTGETAHVGVVHNKDSFYGELAPQTSPVGDNLLERWKSWKALGALASEMESAAIFIVSQARGARAGSVFLVLDNQEREKAGLENPVVHDTEGAIKTAVEGMRILIQKDKEKRAKENGCLLNRRKTVPHRRRRRRCRALRHSSGRPQARGEDRKVSRQRKACGR